MRSGVLSQLSPWMSTLLAPFPQKAESEARMKMLILYLEPQGQSSENEKRWKSSAKDVE